MYVCMYVCISRKCRISTICTYTQADNDCARSKYGYYYFLVLILLQHEDTSYMCPHTTTCVLILIICTCTQADVDSAGSKDVALGIRRLWRHHV
jgi:hypothetical protein